MSEVPNIKLYALHGFLGKPHDWDRSLPHVPKNILLSPVDIYNIAIPCEKTNLWQWATTFNAQIQENTASKNVLMGYSLGGRLALHCVIASASLWKAAVFVSTNIGLSNVEDKKQRLAIDQRWAERFLTEPWSCLLDDWNKQTLFGGNSMPMKKKEEDFSRLLLAKTLTHWSLASQDNLAIELAGLDLPILWIVGENDAAYKAMAEHLHFKHSKSKIWIAKNTSHRVPWDSSDTFKQVVFEFLQDI